MTIISEKSMPEQGKKKLSDSLSVSIHRLYFSATIAISFALIGVVLLLVSHYLVVEVPVWLLNTAAMVSAAVLLAFLFNIVRANHSAKAALARQNAKLDALQDIVLKSTQLLNTAQTIGFKSVSGASKVATKISAVVDAIPGLGEEARRSGLTDKLAGFTQRTTEKSAQFEQSLDKLENALLTSDLKALKEYSAELTRRFQAS